MDVDVLLKRLLDACEGGAVICLIAGPGPGQSGIHDALLRSVWPLAATLPTNQTLPGMQGYMDEEALVPKQIQIKKGGKGGKGGTPRIPNEGEIIRKPDEKPPPST